MPFPVIVNDVSPQQIALAPEISTWPDENPQLIGSSCGKCGATLAVGPPVPPSNAAVQPALPPRTAPIAARPLRPAANRDDEPASSLHNVLSQQS